MNPNGTPNGFRVPPAPTKNEKMRQIETELANLQMAGQISQMMTKQLMQNLKGMSEDLGSALNQLYELQYKYNAVAELLKLDPVVLNELSNKQRLVDFNAASAKEDVKENLVSADEVGIDSTVYITSLAVDEKGNDRGIFRSRLKLSESGVPDMIASLQGKKVGDKVVSKLNGQEHTIELLAIRNPAPQPAASETIQ